MTQTDTPKPDPSKPVPNDGSIWPVDGVWKTWYAVERVLLDPQKNYGLHNDRDALAGYPGFHITQRCPNCDHQTSALCSTEYLATNYDGPASLQRLVDAGTEVGTSSNASAAKAQVAQIRLQADAQPRLPTTSKQSPASVTEASSPTKKRFAMVTVCRCACTYNHVSTTPGGFGCGSEWLVGVHFAATGAAEYFDVTASEAYKYWPAADAAAAQVPNSLTIAQAAAKNWGAVLTALVTLVGVSGLLTDNSPVSTYSDGSKFWFGLAAFIAVAANAVMLYQSNFAAYGSPKIKQALKPSDLTDADLDPLTQASQSVRKMKIAVRVTAVAGVAASCAAGILLFTGPPPAAKTPPAAPSPAMSKITYEVGKIPVTTQCGTYALKAATSTDPAHVSFTPTVKNPRTIDILDRKIKSIVAC